MVECVGESCLGVHDILPRRRNKGLNAAQTHEGAPDFELGTRDEGYRLEKAARKKKLKLL